MPVPLVWFLKAVALLLLAMLLCMLVVKLVGLGSLALRLRSAGRGRAALRARLARERRSVVVLAAVSLLGAAVLRLVYFEAGAPSSPEQIGGYLERIASALESSPARLPRSPGSSWLLRLAWLAVPLSLLGFGWGVFELFRKRRVDSSLRERATSYARGITAMAVSTFFAGASLLPISVDSLLSADSVLRVGSLYKVVQKPADAPSAAGRLLSASVDVEPPFPAGCACDSDIERCRREDMRRKLRESEAIRAAADDVAESFQRDELGLVLVVGSVDFRELKPEYRREYGSNLTLAQSRAECVREILDEFLERKPGFDPGGPPVETMIAGPRRTRSETTDPEGNWVESALARDRVVRILTLSLKEGGE